MTGKPPVVRPVTLWIDDRARTRGPRDVVRALFPKCEENEARPPNPARARRRSEPPDHAADVG